MSAYNSKNELIEGYKGLSNVLRERHSELYDRELPYIYIRHTLNSCKEKAGKYFTPKQWSTGDANSYYAAARNNWLDACTIHMSKRNVWTLEKCILSARSYPHVSDWVKADRKAFDSAGYNGWLKECTAHMLKKPHPTKINQNRSKYLNFIMSHKRKPTETPSRGRNEFSLGKYGNRKIKSDPIFKAEVEALCKKLGIK